MATGRPQRDDSSLRGKKRMWILTGPAGCGKSTVASRVAATLSVPFIEGDEFHTPSSIEKMSSGVPLTDEDRWDWLARLRQHALKVLDGSQSTPMSIGTVPASQGTRFGHITVILTCSALKKAYRDILRGIGATKTTFPTSTTPESALAWSSSGDVNVSVAFIYLHASQELLLSRVRARQGHFMKEAMMKSQFLALEQPSQDEMSKDCRVVRIDDERGLKDIEDEVRKLISTDGFDVLYSATT